MPVGRQFTATHPPHQFGMTEDEQLERSCVPGVGEPREQFPVRHRDIGDGNRERMNQRTRPHDKSVW